MSCSSDYQRAFEVNLLMVSTYSNLSQVIELSHTLCIKFLWGLKTRRFASKITWYSTSSSEYSMHDTKFDPIISVNFLKRVLFISWLMSSNNLFILHLLLLNHILANSQERKNRARKEGTGEDFFPVLSRWSESFPSQAFMSSRHKEKQSSYYCSKKLILQKESHQCIQDLN